jgi:hypothetical protein
VVLNDQRTADYRRIDAGRWTLEARHPPRICPDPGRSIAATVATRTGPIRASRSIRVKFRRTRRRCPVRAQRCRGHGRQWRNSAGEITPAKNGRRCFCRSERPRHRPARRAHTRRVPTDRRPAQQRRHRQARDRHAQQPRACTGRQRLLRRLPQSPRGATRTRRLRLAVRNAQSISPTPNSAAAGTPGPTNSAEATARRRSLAQPRRPARARHHQLRQRAQRHAGQTSPKSPSASPNTCEPTGSNSATTGHPGRTPYDSNAQSTRVYEAEPTPQPYPEDSHVTSPNSINSTRRTY